mmetsp:Transcript_17990/g.57529  ORF Transcript_17990/g.57529 Transcript_17990/m.57529 type:complete len:335 (-) Transcript_17990:123-1127(-)
MSTIICTSSASSATWNHWHMCVKLRCPPWSRSMGCTTSTVRLSRCTSRDRDGCSRRASADRGSAPRRTARSRRASSSMNPFRTLYMPSRTGKGIRLWMRRGSPRTTVALDWVGIRSTGAVYGVAAARLCASSSCTVSVTRRTMVNWLTGGAPSTAPGTTKPNSTVARCTPGYSLRPRTWMSTAACGGSSRTTSLLAKPNSSTRWNAGLASAMSASVNCTARSDSFVTVTVVCPAVPTVPAVILSSPSGCTTIPSLDACNFSYAARSTCVARFARRRIRRDSLNWTRRRSNWVHSSLLAGRTVSARYLALRLFITASTCTTSFTLTRCPCGRIMP